MDAQHTIVIADDHPLFRNALFQSVHMAISGANLLEADSLESLHQILARDAEVDLVLLDLKMPGANGMSGLIALRHQHPSLPIVVVSASEEHRVIRQVRSHGAFGFIPKSSESLSNKLTALTPQQYKVLRMLCDGLLNKQIAYELAVSEATIKAHMTAIFRKLGVNNRTQAVILLQQSDIEL